MTNQEKIARQAIANLTTSKIIEQFELTEIINDAHISIVRGWYMDELEKRDAKAFDNWLESYDESPRKYYLA